MIQFLLTLTMKGISKFRDFDTVRLNDDEVELILFYRAANRNYDEVAILFNDVFLNRKVFLC